MVKTAEPKIKKAAKTEQPETAVEDAPEVIVTTEVNDQTIFARLGDIQQKLKAPKSEYNSFGKYPFRKAEDILNAVKPLNQAHQLTLIMTDDIVAVDGEHFVKSTAALFDQNDDEKSVIVNAFAKHGTDKKGMSSEQETGSASSYARKYALQGLYAIDDSSADPDTKNNAEAPKTARTDPKKAGITAPTAKPATRADLITSSVQIFKGRGLTKEEAIATVTDIARELFKTELTKLTREQALTLNNRVRVAVPSET